MALDSRFCIFLITFFPHELESSEKSLDVIQPKLESRWMIDFLEKVAIEQGLQTSLATA